MQAPTRVACEVSCQGLPNRPASSLCLVKRGYPGAEKLCKKTVRSCRVSAAFVACNTQTSYCNFKRRVLQTNRTGACNSQLLLVSWGLKHDLQLFTGAQVTFELPQIILHGGYIVTRRTLQKNRTGGWALARKIGDFLRRYTVYAVHWIKVR